MIRRQLATLAKRLFAVVAKARWVILVGRGPRARKQEGQVSGTPRKNDPAAQTSRLSPRSTQAMAKA